MLPLKTGFPLFQPLQRLWKWITSFSQAAHPKSLNIQMPGLILMILIIGIVIIIYLLIIIVTVNNINYLSS